MPREYIPVAIDRQVSEAARHRCGYCLSLPRLVMATPSWSLVRSYRVQAGWHPPTEREGSLWAKP